MSDNIYLIYKFTSPSGKSYIGQTNNLPKRISSHRSKHSKCTIIHRAIQKYGWKNITVEILAENLASHQANLLETQYIQQYNTLVPDGYNLNTGGDVRVPSDLLKQKISRGRIGVRLSIDNRTQLSNAHNHLKKKINIDGQIFNSMREVMNAYNIHRSTLRSRLDSKYWNWNYVIANEDEM
ncbi:MAG: GIY-YIG nuclease family protein [Hydrotalea sp. AMD]|uniref:GIY-YIG nuclease family protein n=1 Tax=Hydrotalea sp. AMD TaxID=2501297 RepID=UPI001025C7F2|nr:GIY-YIG nuclease family protein [Hydrotalea sp. AMD]RWZ87232.1 MAG: GIY-YIG nuclease family protein [Hydrotalea sp. AMD]